LEKVLILSLNIQKIKTMYPAELTAPMAKDLTENGFESLTTPEEVNELLNATEGTTLVVVNSVCGCAAANARPGAKMAIDNEKKPDRLTTVFAGVDHEATARAREFMLPYPPSFSIHCFI
jgi:putative YphP/YqiW family bacilliredoxin